LLDDGVILAVKKDVNFLLFVIPLAVAVFADLLPASPSMICSWTLEKVLVKGFGEILSMFLTKKLFAPKNSALKNYVIGHLSPEKTYMARPNA